MNTIQKFWERIFPPILPLPVGIYHYQAPADSPFPYRLHLRIEPDGHGLLIVNASTVLHLNNTAVEYAYHLLKNTPEAQAVEQIAKRYRVKKETIMRDYADLMQRIKTLIETPDLDPVAFLDFDRQDPYTGASSAPYRLDCALTYRLPDGGHHVAPLERVKRELLDVEWKQILDKAWQAGIPHAVFTGGEPTLRPDLVDLIEYTEQLGMVAGVITDGLRLSESKYLHALLQAGLDHVMLLLDPDEEQSWEALRDVLSEDIAVIVHLTITGYSPEQFPALLDRLAGMGVQNISLSAESTGLKDALLAARQAVAEKQMRLIWDLPVPYTHFHPVAIELAEEMEGVDAVDYGPGHAWLYVEPDGDVLTGQGYYQTVLGNLLMDSWDKVWEKAKTAVAA